jgi:hypothetical protein
MGIPLRPTNAATPIPDTGDVESQVVQDPQPGPSSSDVSALRKLPGEREVEQIRCTHASARKASTSAANSAWCWKRKPCAASQ